VFVTFEDAKLARLNISIGNTRDSVTGISCLRDSDSINSVTLGEQDRVCMVKALEEALGVTCTEDQKNTDGTCKTVQANSQKVQEIAKIAKESELLIQDGQVVKDAQGNLMLSNGGVLQKGELARREQIFIQQQNTAQQALVESMLQKTASCMTTLDFAQSTCTKKENEEQTAQCMFLSCRNENEYNQLHTTYAGQLDIKGTVPTSLVDQYKAYYLTQIVGNARTTFSSATLFQAACVSQYSPSSGECSPEQLRQFAELKLENVDSTNKKAILALVKETVDRFTLSSNVKGITTACATTNEAELYNCIDRLYGNDPALLKRAKTAIAAYLEETKLQENQANTKSGLVSLAKNYPETFLFSLSPSDCIQTLVTASSTAQDAASFCAIQENTALEAYCEGGRGGYASVKDCIDNRRKQREITFGEEQAYDPLGSGGGGSDVCGSSSSGYGSYGCTRLGGRFSPPSCCALPTAEQTCQVGEKKCSNTVVFLCLSMRIGDKEGSQWVESSSSGACETQTSSVTINPVPETKPTIISYSQRDPQWANMSFPLEASSDCVNKFWTKGCGQTTSANVLATYVDPSYNPVNVTSEYYRFSSCDGTSLTQNQQVFDAVGLKNEFVFLSTPNAPTPMTQSDLDDLKKYLRAGWTVVVDGVFNGKTSHISWITGIDTDGSLIFTDSYYGDPNNNNSIDMDDMTIAPILYSALLVKKGEEVTVLPTLNKGQRE